MITELAPGRLEAVHVAEIRGGELVPAGQVKFGLARTGLWEALDQLRDGLPARKGFVAVRPELVAQVKYFGRYQRGRIRDGVLLSVGPRSVFPDAAPLGQSGGVFYFGSAARQTWRAITACSYSWTIAWARACLPAYRPSVRALT